MRCPKCGAFMEQGKDVCLMCGTNARTYVPQNNGGFNNNNRTSDGMFGSGTGTATNTFTKNYNQPKVDYRNVQLAPVKNGERDIFDFFSENKKVISTTLFILFV
jgi:predicted  nucleic acid-binding Zn-ribbon protein